MNFKHQSMNILFHQPNRRITTDGLWDPDMTNGQRAEFAGRTLREHRLRFNLIECSDEATDATDLIANLLHYLHSRNGDALGVLEKARDHFLSEAG